MINFGLFLLNLQMFSHNSLANEGRKLHYHIQQIRKFQKKKCITENKVYNDRLVITLIILITNTLSSPPPTHYHPLHQHIIIPSTNTLIILITNTLSSPPPTHYHPLHQHITIALHQHITITHIIIPSTKTLP